MGEGMEVARLLFPAIRWSDEGGFDGAGEEIERALDLGVGGFIIFGGRAEAVAALTGDLRRRSRVPILIGADLERGAGQQFSGATPLPPLAALGSLTDLEVIRSAGQLTAREARALGIDWVYAPDADLDIEPRNPIIGTRSFGSDPEIVAAQLRAWIEGCQAGGALSSAKHFPGHGRTTIDSHISLPVVAEGRAGLEMDLLPFRAAIDAGVSGVMTAHVSYPALDPSGAPATLSERIIGGILRGELGYDGLVVTDALIMDGVRGSGESAVSAEVEAIMAGCDILLYPHDLEGVAVALDTALGNQIPRSRVAESIRRLERTIEWVGQGARGEVGLTDDLEWADEIALRTIRLERGRSDRPVGRGADVEFSVVTIDDDLGGPYPPPARRAFLEGLRGGGRVVREVEPSDLEEIRRGAGEVVVALYADIRGWKGRPGLSAEAIEVLGRILEVRGDATIVLFGHPRLAGEVPGTGARVVTAWGGEPLMQSAAARWLNAEE